jgi:mannose-1-phosphate guanylyltransferase/mannose-6-phosphate isomerase
MKTPRRLAHRLFRRAGAAVLIIAGGRGTRFWPLSRASRPKPLFSLDGKTSLLDATVARARMLVPRDQVFVLVARENEAAFRRAIRALLPPKNLIVEPQARGTAVAIAYGAAMVRRRLGDVTLAVMPADHIIEPPESFRSTLADAIALARGHRALVVIGVPPTRAEPGYGYQKIGRKVGAGFRVDSFVEKPSRAKAEKMVRSGRYLWNAGMFVMDTGGLDSELAMHCPRLGDAIARIATDPRKAAQIYSRLDFDSFDRVVVEKSSNVLTVKARFRWHDVGSWHGLWDAMRRRGGRARDDNVLAGNVIALDAIGSIAHANRRLMVLAGVENIVVIDAGDAILIAQRSEHADIRRVTEELKRRGLQRYL